MEFITILLLFCFGILAVRPVGSYSQTRDQTHTPCLEKGSPHHWAPIQYFCCDFVKNLFSFHDVKMDARAPKLPCFLLSFHVREVLPCARHRP